MTSALQTATTTTTTTTTTLKRNSSLASEAIRFFKRTRNAKALGVIYVAKSLVFRGSERGDERQQTERHLADEHYPNGLARFPFLTWWHGDALNSNVGVHLRAALQIGGEVEVVEPTVLAADVIELEAMTVGAHQTGILALLHRAGRFNRLSAGAFPARELFELLGATFE